MIQFHLEKKFRGRGHLPFEINLDFKSDPSTQVIALSGESGSGKSSILKMISGLMSPDNGRIAINESTWFDSAKNVNVAVQKRNVGFVFQEHALFPHMTVLQNVSFASSNGQDRAREFLETVTMTDYIHHKPLALSGGQLQRVALARALNRNPSLLLLDEPLSALDSQNRTRLQHVLKDIFNTLDIPIILVSHDTAEASLLCDTVVEIRNGKIL